MRVTSEKTREREIFESTWFFGLCPLSGFLKIDNTIFQKLVLVLSSYER
jgi:hypothetical protein